MTDYRVYVLTRPKRLLAMAAGLTVCFTAGFVLYRSIGIASALSAVGLFYPKLLQKSLRRKRQNRLRLHFKEILQALSSLLIAGRSVENAFCALEHELAYLSVEGNSELLQELRIIANRLRNGEALERPITDWAERSGIEEISSFADVLAVCKRSGGNLVEVVKRTSQLLGEKMETELELMVVMAGKRFESRLLMAMPFGFVGLLGWFASDYMSVLQQGAGLGVLTTGLALLGLCSFWMYRISDIRI